MAVTTISTGVKHGADIDFVKSTCARKWKHNFDLTLLYISKILQYRNNSILKNGYSLFQKLF